MPSYKVPSLDLEDLVPSESTCGRPIRGLPSKIERDTRRRERLVPPPCSLFKSVSRESDIAATDPHRGRADWRESPPGSFLKCSTLAASAGPKGTSRVGISFLAILDPTVWALKQAVMWRKTSAPLVRTRRSRSHSLRGDQLPLRVRKTSRVFRSALQVYRIRPPSPVVEPRSDLSLGSC